MADRSPANKEKFLKQAKDRFKLGQDAIHPQRQRELDDLAFYAGGDYQWDPDALKARRTQPESGDGLPPIPARPVVTINKVREPVHTVLNQERQSDMTIELAPADDFEALIGPLDPMEIELREGLVRRIQRQSEAADARTWAFTRAVIAGVGYYRVTTRWAKGKTMNKIVCLERIYDQASVTLDPSHVEPDGSDAEWGFIGGMLVLERLRSEYGEKVDRYVDRLEHLSDSDFEAYGQQHPGWFDGGKKDLRAVRVTEYLYTETTTRTLLLLEDGSEVWDDEAPEGAKIVDEREVPSKTIKWAKILGATEILEETEIEGEGLGIIKILGEELQPFNEERRAEGMIRQARDGNQGFNIFISKFVEMVGLTPLTDVALDPLQIEGPYRKWWQLRATRSLPFLPVNRFSPDGKDYGQPQTLDRTAPIGEVATGLQIFDEAIKSTTLVPSVQLGQNTDARLKSGRAINLLQTQAQLGTSNYLDNLKRSIRYEGDCINSRLYPVYGKKPGRIVQIMTGEGESDHRQIGPPPTPGQPGAAPTNGNGRPPIKIAQLTENANLNVIVKVTRAFESRRTEEAQTIADMLQANPVLMSWFGDLFFKNQDGPGHEEMAERAKVMLDPKIQQLLAQKAQGQAIPPELLAQMTQLQGRLQHAETIMQAMGQELKTKQAELENKLQIESLKREKEVLLQEMKNAAQLRVAEIAARKEVVAGAVEDQEEALALALTHAHETTEAALDRAHQRTTAREAQDHAAAMGAAQAGATAAQSTQDHQQGMEAAAQPPPVNPNQQPPSGGGGSSNV